MGFCLIGAVYSLDQKGVLAPNSQNTSSIVGVASLTVTSNNPLAGFLLPCPDNFELCWSGDLISNRKASTGDTITSFAELEDESVSHSVVSDLLKTP